MLAIIFEILDGWINDENKEARREGLRAIAKCEFRIVGQMALMEAKLDLHIAVTGDVDAFNNAHHSVMTKWNDLLIANGLKYDLLSNEIWMPAETIYLEIYKGDWVTAFRAEPEYIMISKAKMAMEKNRLLLRQYIASRPPQIFFDLCLKYSVNLDRVWEE